MDGATILRMGLTLALLLAVPGALLWMARRFGWRVPGQPGGNRRLRIVARTPIDARHSLLLIRRDAQEQLLLLGPGGPTVLDPAIRLSREDRAEQKRVAAEDTARAAAAERVLADARARMIGAGAALRGAAGKLREATGPSFARLVERAGARS